MAKPLTPLQAYLAPLTKLALKHPEIEAEVIWAKDGLWQAQSDDAEFLDGEEVPFYAEGLLIEGFALHYQILADCEAPAVPVHIRLFFWQSDAPAIESPEPELALIGSATWTG
ncbi:MAG: hypothetical protein ACOH2M_19735 [Cypionkella sp.]